MSANGLPAGGSVQNMSLRHYTASAALPIAMEMMKIAAAQGIRVEFSPQSIAANARLIADALIEELGLIHGAK